ncbi:hypothetical protein CFAM422_011692 [Trichoderma lentiforme]|uniref:C2H2-type domain-containing protein n=1 Tax=Trichoderma lentiforme TaxID=1567552 RepID=A0A9P5C9E8_9HYPO|nr:hypothetical protein CFAM422_011692 [Trichoderma lentiforme]
MDWNSCQNPDFMSFLDHNIDWDLLMDSTLFGDNSMDELLAAAGSHNNLTPNFPDTEEAMIYDNDISSLQFDFNQFLPTSNSSQCQAIDPSFELVGEDYTTLDTATTPSTWSSGNTTLSPTEKFLSMSPPTFLNCQLPEMSSHNEGQPESFGRRMPITPMNPPRNPTYVQKPRRRKRKDSGMLKREERKVSKPEQCHICGLGHAQKRDLDRHMVSNHRKEAERLGLDVSKISCRVCGFEFDGIRRDRLVRHMKRKHPNSL